MIKVALAEDHKSLIEGIEVFFECEDDMEIVGKVNNGQQLITFLERKPVDVIIMDIQMPVMDGVEATKYITKEFPEVKVIAFSMFEQDSAIEQMRKAGAKGYLPKNASLLVLLEAIRRVNIGEECFGLTTRKDVVNGKKSTIKRSTLTRRQQEILQLIGERKTNREIAKELFIEVSTVGTHRKNMIQKLNLTGQGALLAYALKKRFNFE